MNALKFKPESEFGLTLVTIERILTPEILRWHTYQTEQGVNLLGLMKQSLRNTKIKSKNLPSYLKAYQDVNLNIRSGL